MPSFSIGVQVRTLAKRKGESAPARARSRTRAAAGQVEGGCSAARRDDASGGACAIGARPTRYQRNDLIQLGILSRFLRRAAVHAERQRVLPPPRSTTVPAKPHIDAGP